VHEAVERTVGLGIGHRLTGNHILLIYIERLFSSSICLFAVCQESGGLRGALFRGIALCVKGLSFEPKGFTTEGTENTEKLRRGIDLTKIQLGNDLSVCQRGRWPQDSNLSVPKS